jgi:putative transcriptional regulator
MSATESLKSQLLIAMPSLEDPNFARTVTYLCEHAGDGAMGIVLNRPTELSLVDMLEHMEIDGDFSTIEGQFVFAGGPVETERGIVLHSGDRGWDATLAVGNGISMTTSRDILEAMVRGEGPEQSLVALGYAGWGAGQLEREMQQNAWLSGPSDPSIVFELPPDQRWDAAARLLGVDIRLLSSEAGHA